MRAETIDWIESDVLVDRGHEYKKKNWSKDSQNKPHTAFLMNPWACGIACSNLLVHAHQQGIAILNQSPFYSPFRHLYHSFRALGHIPRSWSVMDRLRLASRDKDPFAYDLSGATHQALLTIYADSYNMSVVDLLKHVKEKNSFPPRPHLLHHLGRSALATLVFKNFKLDDDVLSLDTLEQMFPSDFPSADARSMLGSRLNIPLPRTNEYGPISLLEATETHVEQEVQYSSLTIDLFNLERLSFLVVNGLHDSLVAGGGLKLNTILSGKDFGDLGQESDVSLTVLALLVSLARREGRKKNDQQTKVAVEAFNRSREELESKIKRSPKFGYFPRVVLS